ncbi:MAG: hypothetical protein PHF67_01220 [Candidatus Nanoarchaeia archaeon]|nr:hypothetical protein [Candidatus Nanoarchaeia archaeon]
MNTRRQFLAYGAAALFGVAGLSSAGCVTANYNAAKVNGRVPNANVRILESMANQPAAPVSLDSGEHLPLDESRRLYDTYNGNLAPQRISFVYQEPGNTQATFERTLDTSGPFNARGNDISLYVMQQLMTQVPEDARTTTYDLGTASREDTLSPRTPGNKLSRDDGLYLVQAYSNSENRNFVIRVKEASKVTKNLRRKDDYYIEIDFNQPEFRAEKRRKDLRYLLDTGLDGLFASTAFFAGPYGYVTPAVAVAVDGVDGLVAYVEGKKAPKDALFSTDTTLITSLPRHQALTTSVLDNSARTRSSQLAFVPLFDGCNRPSGQGVVFLDNAAYGFCVGPNFASFCTSKDRGSELLHLLRGWSRFVPVVVKKTTTKTYTSGGGRNGGPGEDSFSGGDRGGEGGGLDSFGGGRGVGSD